MPRNYRRTSTRQSWSEINMTQAINEVLIKNMGCLKAAKTYSVPQSTLESRVKKVKSGVKAEEASKKGMGRYKTVFTPEQEQELVEHVLTMQSRSFGITMLELRTLAYELAVRNGVGNRFDAKRKMAGTDWLQGFLKRHTELSLKTHENAAAAPAVGFNRSAVAKFFDLLGSLFEKYNFSPTDIYNVNETVITTVSSKPSELVESGGKKESCDSVSPQHAVRVTAEICISAAGVFMPTMFVFPCKKADHSLLEDALPGSTAEYDETGCMQRDLFMKWFKQFLRFASPAADKPVLLLLDGQASHTKSMELINLARESNVVVLCFPPNCTHRMQPLDVSFMATLGSYYEEEVEKWIFANPGCGVTLHQVAKFFGAAYMRAAVLGTAVNGFKETGIYPLNPNVFPDYLFDQSDISDRLVSSSDFTENLTRADDPLHLPENLVETELHSYCNSTLNFS